MRSEGSGRWVLGLRSTCAVTRVEDLCSICVATRGGDLDAEGQYATLLHAVRFPAAFWASEDGYAASTSSPPLDDRGPDALMEY